MAIKCIGWWKLAQLLTSKNKASVDSTLAPNTPRGTKCTCVLRLMWKQTMCKMSTATGNGWVHSPPQGVTSHLVNANIQKPEVYTMHCTVTKEYWAMITANMYIFNFWSLDMWPLRYVSRNRQTHRHVSMCLHTAHPWRGRRNSKF